jgi:hypothetical protein
MRRLITLCESLYPNVREIPGGERFVVYHGSASITPFDMFDPEHINSATGKSYNAFFFAERPDTAMTYMQTEEELKPNVQTQYDEWMATFLRSETPLLDKLNDLLASHRLPPMKTYSSTTLMLLALRTKDETLKTTLRAIGDEHSSIAKYRNAALDLYDKERNLETFHTGILYKCAITLFRPWERHMAGDAFQRDRWHDIFTTATQSGADGVILYDCVDTAVEFGRPDTIYAVFTHDQIKILSHEVLEHGK